MLRGLSREDVARLPVATRQPSSPHAPHLTNIAPKGHHGPAKEEYSGLLRTGRSLIEGFTRYEALFLCTAVRKIISKRLNSVIALPSASTSQTDNAQTTSTPKLSAHSQPPTASRASSTPKQPVAGVSPSPSFEPPEVSTSTERKTLDTPNAHASFSNKFGSFDSGPPAPSQSSTNSGASKRVISNGQDVVLNSDSDSDSLPDLDFGEPKKHVVRVHTPIGRPKRILGRDADDDLRKPVTKVNPNKRSFNRLIETAESNLATERRIQEHKATFVKVEQSPRKAVITLDESLLSQAVDDDEDAEEKARRLLLAIQRTNAAQTEELYHFFGDTRRAKRTQRPFPAMNAKPVVWNSIFRRQRGQDAEARRTQAFLSGAAYQYFRFRPLNDDAALWLIDEICFGQHEGLSGKYLDILKLNCDQASRLLDIPKLDIIFERLQAKTEDLQAEKIEPSSNTHEHAEIPLPSELRSVLRFFRDMASRFEELLIW